jgi:Spy/CpxP family protein refolding chaperone
MLAGLILLLAMNSGNAYEGPGKHEDGAHWKEHKQHLMQELGLTDDQQQQLKDHRARHRKDHQALKEQIRAKREEIRMLLEKEDFDKDQVYQLHNQLKALKLRAEDHRLEGILEVRGILTPEQYRRFGEMKDDLKKQ